MNFQRILIPTVILTTKKLSQKSWSLGTSTTWNHSYLKYALAIVVKMRKSRNLTRG